MQPQIIHACLAGTESPTFSPVDSGSYHAVFPPASTPTLHSADTTKVNQGYRGDFLESVYAIHPISLTDRINYV